MVLETWVQSQFASYQKLKKWYLRSPCLKLSNIRYVSRVKWSNPGKGVAAFPTPLCSSYWKESLRVALDYGCQLYLLWCIPLSLQISSNNDEVSVAIKRASPCFRVFINRYPSCKSYTNNTEFICCKRKGPIYTLNSDTSKISRQVHIHRQQYLINWNWYQHTPGKCVYCYRQVIHHIEIWSLP